MKVLCIGDSLGLPRKGCNYEDTWVSLLRKRYPNHTFIDHFSGDRLISNAAQNYEIYYKYYNPDIVIFQQGICDCAPRYIDDKKLSTRIIRKVFYALRLQSFFWRLVKLHKRSPDCVHTRPEKFLEVFKTLIDKILSEGGRVIIIKIGHGAEPVISASPFFNNNVDRYNALIDQIADNNDRIYVVDPLLDVREELFVDGYHCGPLGMEKVYDTLCSVLDKLIL